MSKSGLPSRRRGPKNLSNEHKEAMASGRAEGRAVRTYLEALESNKPRRGRRRTTESIETRLTAIAERMQDADPLTRLNLIQERMDLNEELLALANENDISDLEADFIDVAKNYGDRRGITYAAWRELGVSAQILSRSGITRARK